MEGSSGISERTPLLADKDKRLTSVMKVAKTLIPCVLLYAVGVLGLMLLEGWPLLLSNYVVVQMLTTIGYGDFRVKSTAAKIFVSLYAVVALAVLAYYFNHFVEKLLAWEAEALRRHLRDSERALLDGASKNQDQRVKAEYGAFNQAVAGSIIFAQVVLFGIVFYRYMEHCTCSYGLHSVPDCKEDTFEVCVLTGGYVKDWTSCFYMTMITLTTIGFGDYQPRTMLGRVLGMIWMLVGVGATAMFLSNWCTYLFERRKKERYMSADAIDIDDSAFDVIDSDHDGNISRGEYLAYTLVKYGFVQQELLDEINAQYAKLEGTSGGGVTREDLRMYRAIHSQALSACSSASA